MFVAGILPQVARKSDARTVTKRFTDGYYAFDLKADAVKQKLQELGLLRRQNETDSFLIRRACLWLAKNKNASPGAHGTNSVKIFDETELNCNGASKTLLAILKNNGIATKANPRLHLNDDGSTSQNSDIIAYISDQKKWVGISGAVLISGGRELAIKSGISGRIRSFGKDIDGFQGTFIDMADDVGHMMVIPEISRYSSFFNEVNPTWSKVGSNGQVRGKMYYQFTQKFTPIDIQNEP